MNRLKELRKTVGLSQNQIAEKIGLTQKTYSNYESGATEPTMGILIKIADFFKVSVDYLLGREFFKEQTEQEKELLDTFTQLSSLEQGMILGYAKKTLESVKQAKEQELKNRINQGK